MKQKRFTEEQKAFALPQADSAIAHILRADAPTKPPPRDVRSAKKHSHERGKTRSWRSFQGMIVRDGGKECGR